MKLALTANKEWGSKARKEQEALCGLNAQDRRRDIAERISEELVIIADYAQAERTQRLHEILDIELPALLAQYPS